MKRSISAICFVALLVFSFYSPHSVLAAPTSITVPIAQWNSLKDNSNRLAANLMLLEESLTQQERRQEELMSLLTSARSELKKTQEALKTANGSLETAKASLKTANELSEKLKKQLDSERKQAEKEKKNAYRKGWLNGFCVGAAGTMVIVFTK